MNNTGLNYTPMVQSGSWFNQRGYDPDLITMGQNPYLGTWSALIGQLMQQAQGKGPSLAQNAYRQASDDAMSGQMAMARNGGAGSARTAAYNMGHVQQGLAQGLAQARAQEQLGSYGALMSALGGAGTAWFQPNAANLQSALAQQQIYAQQPSRGQQVTGFLGNTLSGLGSVL